MVITLKEDTKTLDEVVVVGYQEIRKMLADLTGSVDGFSVKTPPKPSIRMISSHLTSLKDAPLLLSTVPVVPTSARKCMDQRMMEKPQCQPDQEMGWKVWKEFVAKPQCQRGSLSYYDQDGILLNQTTNVYKAVWVLPSKRRN